MCESALNQYWLWRKEVETWRKYRGFLTTHLHQEASGKDKQTPVGFPKSWGVPSLEWRSHRDKQCRERKRNRDRYMCTYTNILNIYNLLPFEGDKITYQKL